jgi:hypothetical protein
VRENETRNRHPIGGPVCRFGFSTECRIHRGGPGDLGIPLTTFFRRESQPSEHAAIFEGSGTRVSWQNRTPVFSHVGTRSGQASIASLVV